MRINELSVVSSQRLAVPALGLIVVLLAGVVAGFFWEAVARRAAAAQTAADEPDSLPQRHAALHVRYAEARLGLALADLQKALDLVRMQPGQVAESELRALHNHVTVLRDHVEATRRQPHGNAFDLAQATARAAVTEADDELALARAANSHQPDAVSARTMQQLTARADVAHARLTLWEDPAFLQSPLQVMQMQIDQLADQVLELTHHIDNAPTIKLR